jgi:hypothetical protein
VASATITVTKRNIAEREAKILQLRTAARKLPKGSPKKAAYRKRVGDLKLEIAALKASLHYYKPTDQLTSDITLQQRKVKALTAAFKKAPGAAKKAIGGQLRAEAKVLNEMTAAARVQQAKTGLKSPLPVKPRNLALVRPNPVGEEAAALEAEAGTPAPEASDQEVMDVEAGSVPDGFSPSEFSVAAASGYAQEVLDRLDDAAEELDEYVNEEGEVWYKNPVVLLGAGVATWLVLRRR